MKIEEHRQVRIDGENILSEWADIATGEKRYEADGQISIRVHGPQGVNAVPVRFHFAIEASSIAEAAEKFGATLQEAGKKAEEAAIHQINANEKKIQIARGDQLIHPDLCH